MWESLCKSNINYRDCLIPQLIYSNFTLHSLASTAYWIIKRPDDTWTDSEALNVNEYHFPNSERNLIMNTSTYCPVYHILEKAEKLWYPWNHLHGTFSRTEGNLSYCRIGEQDLGWKLSSSHLHIMKLSDWDSYVIKTDTSLNQTLY